MKFRQLLVGGIAIIVAFAGGIYFSGGGEVSVDNVGSADYYPSKVQLKGELSEAELTATGLIIRGDFMGLAYGQKTGTIIFVTTPDGNKVAGVKQDETSMIEDRGVYFAPIDKPQSGAYTIEVTKPKSSTSLEREVVSVQEVELTPDNG